MSHFAPRGMRPVRSRPDRRSFLIGAAALSAAVLPVTVAQAVSGISGLSAPVSIDVAARRIPAFDTRDKTHLLFGSLQYRSGLVLKSDFAGFGGLSALRLDPKGERFIALSDKGTWFTGRIVYDGDVMIGLDDVEAAPILGADG